MKAGNWFFGLVLAGSIWAWGGCTPEPPRYEAVARIGYRYASTDLKLEEGFLRNETFLRIVFEQLSESELQEFAANTPKRELFRQFVHDAYARPGKQDRELEVCVVHPNADVAAALANRIVATYLSVRGDQARLIARAVASKTP
jgi:hypothetical protein